MTKKLLTREKLKGQLVGYSRVSTTEQKADAQEDALKAAGCTKLFADQLSGKNVERPGLNRALEYMREGDTLVVYKLDRLSRSTKDMLMLAEQLKERGINLKSLSDDIDTSTPHGSFFFTICAAFAQLEREMIVSRTKAGLEAARARGKLGGRPQKVSKEQAETARVLLSQGKGVREVCGLLGLKRSTMYDAIAKFCPGE